MDWKSIKEIGWRLLGIALLAGVAASLYAGDIDRATLGAVMVVFYAIESKK